MAEVTADPKIGAAVITRELVRAVFHAAEAMIARARETEKFPEYSAGNGVGRILREQVESDKQRYALLKDWIERHRSFVGLLEEEVRS